MCVLILILLHVCPHTTIYVSCRYIGGSGQEDVLIIEGSQANLREDSLDRNPGPATRVNAVPRYPGDELEYDVTEWHDEWKKATEANRAATIGA